MSDLARAIVRPRALAAAACLAACASAGAVTAAGYVVMHSFQKTDGFGVFGELARAGDGTLFGTGFFGGDSDAGAAFSVKPTGKYAYTSLHAFDTTDGLASATGLALGADGNFYGLTGGGGQYSAGTAFRVSPAGAFTSLHAFDGAKEGKYAYLGTLARASDGNFYGAMSEGGASGLGTIFRMTPTGQVTVLHAFAGGLNDGATPRGGLTAASDGKLYGTTVCGGVKTKTAGCGGTLYRIDPATGAFSLVSRFGPTDAPQAAPVELNGFLYGTTSAGGDTQHGSIYKITLAAPRTFTTLHSFAGGVRGSPANQDGAVPTGRLLVASDGNLYGTTSMGGSNASIDPNGDGIIFRLTPAGAFTVVHTFGASASDSARPFAGLVQGTDGSLYGTAHNGAYQSEGTVFKIALPAP
jgi:uncharacterized repeat protein (TIGR03803 family)